MIYCSRISLAATLVILFSVHAFAVEDSDHGGTMTPHVVIILLDDLGFSDLGFLGSEIKTPNIDAIAAGGLTVTNLYVHPRCSPTRASLLTGRYPHEAGMGILPTPAGADVPRGPFQGYLDPEVPTIAEILKGSGYKTYMSGKWHLGEGRAHWPIERGFDKYFGLISGASSYWEIIRNQPMHRQMAMNDEAWTPPDSGFYMTQAITEQAIDYLHQYQRSDSKSPFFLYLAYTAPHWPLHAPEADIAHYQGRYDEGPEIISRQRLSRMEKKGLVLPAPMGALAFPQAGDHTWADRMEVYAAMVTAVDRGIGQVIHQLRRSGQLDNTLVLLMSDNGASAEDISRRNLHQVGSSVGQRGSYLSYGTDWATVSNTPFREHKGTTFEGGIRSPLIAHWPEGIKAAGVIDQSSVLSVADIVPTILNHVAAEHATEEMRGQDFSSLFRSAPFHRQRPLFWEHVGWRAVRDGQWKAVFDQQDKQWMLFDFHDDPFEENDIANTNTQRLTSLSTAWEAWSKEMGIDGFDLRTLRKYYSSER